ncbi:MAG: TetR/AcrR family transcriptional regulator [Ornithinimicrobium sp.]
MHTTRAPLTTESLVGVCRELLNEGGPDAVVVREVARRMGVTAPALYKHVDGRDELLTLLIAACGNEVADACATARDSLESDDYPGQLRAATEAFRDWALANRAEFGLIYGTPIVGYEAPAEGPTTQSSQRFGAVFAGIYLGLLSTGRLRLVERATMTPQLISTLESNPTPGDHQLPAEAAYQFAVGWHRLLGMVSVEVAGHLDWMMTDSSAFVQAQLESLFDEMVSND